MLLHHPDCAFAYFGGKSVGFVHGSILSGVGASTKPGAIQDATGYTTYTSGGTATPVQWTKISNVNSYSGFDGSASEIERTNFDSTAKEFILGLFDPGAFAIEVDQDNSDAGQLALMTALVTGVAKSFKLLLPNGNTATFTAYMKKFNSQGAVDQAIRRSAELRISGSITWA